MTDTGAKPGSSGEFKSSTLIEFFDQLQAAQLENARDVARLIAEMDNMKNLLALNGTAIDTTLKNAQELFDMRTAMVLHDNDAMKAQFREVAAVFQRSIDALNSTLDSRLLVMEKRIADIRRDDSTVTAARITRMQVIVVAAITSVLSFATALVTVLATRGH